MPEQRGWKLRVGLLETPPDCLYGMEMREGYFLNRSYFNQRVEMNLLGKVLQLVK